MFLPVKLRLYILILIGYFLLQSSHPGGLRFKGGERPIEKRTSYSVFANRSVGFKHHFDVAFNLSLQPEKEIGYILRIKNEKSKKIYNLFYDGQGANLVFRFNEEGKHSLITAEADKQALYDMEWFRVKISFDLEKDSLFLYIDGVKHSTGNIGLPRRYYPDIVFGKDDYFIDVPSFSIKNLRVGNNKHYLFPLNEHEGGRVHDKLGRPLGEVMNPEWLINDAYHWRKQVTFSSESIAGSNYNPQTKNVYYFNSDSIRIYNIRNGETSAIQFNEACPVRLKLGTNFLDRTSGKLYTYEVHYDTPYEGPTIASLDLKTMEWQEESYDRLPIQLHHHGGFMEPEEKVYSLFGGFGNMQYSNNIYTYNLEEKKWSEAVPFNKSNLTPRYFSSVGHLKGTEFMYIFGGMGNESGEQIVGREYYYDLQRVNLQTGKVEKLWDLPWSKENVVPVRGMVILNDTSFYTLCYPEHMSESYLLLYKFSIKDGSYEVLGDTIPIRSDRITTHANLYYDEGMNCLLALVQEFDDDIKSTINVYTLDFPPVSMSQMENFSGTGGRYSIVRYSVVSLLILLSIAGGWIYYRRTNASKDAFENPKDINLLGVSGDHTSEPNSIYLFGGFRVSNRNNQDISHLFSTKLKQVLCLLLKASLEGGISSQRLSDEIWPETPSNKVKNTRGVTLNHLRKALDELDGIDLIYENGYYRLIQTEAFYCDYYRCFEIVQSGIYEENKTEFLKIIARGKFLQYSDQSVFDGFKESTEQKLEPYLLRLLENSYLNKEYKSTLILSNAIFNIDPLNDLAFEYQIGALQKLKKADEARQKYQSFVNEYKKIMGNEYPNLIKV